jgi:hypothetical protein
MVRRRVPYTVDLLFTIIGASDHTVELLNLMATTELFFHRNKFLEMDRNPASPLGGRVRYEMDLAPDGDLRVTSQPNASNVRSFSGSFVIRGFDLEDLAGIAGDAVIERTAPAEEVAARPTGSHSYRIDATGMSTRLLANDPPGCTAKELVDKLVARPARVVTFDLPFCVPHALLRDPRFAADIGYKDGAFNGWRSFNWWIAQRLLLTSSCATFTRAPRAGRVGQRDAPLAHLLVCDLHSFAPRSTSSRDRGGRPARRCTSPLVTSKPPTDHMSWMLSTASTTNGGRPAAASPSRYCASVTEANTNGLPVTFATTSSVRLASDVIAARALCRSEI